jgi:predicted ArsR family transcriptional regulator
MTSSSPGSPNDPTRDTRAQLKKLFTQHPTSNANELAAMLGVTPSRVRDLAKELKRQWVVTGRWKRMDGEE